MNAKEVKSRKKKGGLRTKAFKIEGIKIQSQIEEYKLFKELNRQIIIFGTKKKAR